MKSINLSKYYYTIGETSKIVGVKQSVLRYWEKEFNISNGKYSKNSHRRYSKEDVKKFLKIKYLLYEKKIKISKAKELIYSRKKSLSKIEIINELRNILNILKGCGA